jgi:hypothetical protein
MSAQTSLNVRQGERVGCPTKGTQQEVKVNVKRRISVSVERKFSVPNLCKHKEKNADI